MAQKTIVSRLKQKYDTKSNWSTNNPTLLAGEIGIESDTNLFKFGDGTKKWNELPYAGTDASKIEEMIEAAEDNVYAVTGTEAGDLADIAGSVSTPKKGDIAVVKRLIAEDKYSHTAYVYSGTQWEAADGNYDATNVYFASDLVITANIGVQTIGASGSKTLETAGKNVKQVLDMIVAQEKNPTITQPSATLNSSNIGTKEVGTNITIAYSFNTNPGSYQYGPATGVTFDNYSATFNGETLNTSSGTFAEVQVTDDTNLTITGSVTHSNGATPKTNLGNDYAAGKITGKTLNPSKGTLRGFRGWFYGYKNGTNAIADPNAITSEEIRALSSPSTSIPSQISTNQMKQMFFAIPKGLKKSVSVADATNGAPQTVTKITDVMVAGANGYSAIAYDVWFVNNAAAASGSAKFNITVK